MIRLPLWVEFPNVLSQFGAGFKSVRTASNDYFNANFSGFDGEIEQVEGGTMRSANTSFADGSGMQTSVVQYEDGSIGVSHTFIAKSKEALTALLDGASAGFTEVDSQSLAAGLSK